MKQPKPSQILDWRRALKSKIEITEYYPLAKAIRSTIDDSSAVLQPLKIGFLSSHSIQFVDPFLVVEGARLNYNIDVFYGEFGQLEQQLIDPTSELYRFEPDLIVLSFRIEDVDPNATTRFYASNGQRFKKVQSEICRRLHDSLQAFASRSSAPALVANFAPPQHLPLGVFERNAKNTLSYELDRANQALRQALEDFPSAFVWDYAGIVAQRGTSSWTDPRMWATGRIAVSREHQPSLARHLSRTINGILLPPAKCVALDLDNTIWGGVIGDDGLAGIHLSDDYPGNAFKMFQRMLLALMDRGILLTIVSKNDESVAKDAFQNHPEMLIRWEDLSAYRINWEPKSQNIRAIAKELNIGAEAIVLIDDNPVERAEVRSHAPEVLVLELPADPLQFCSALAESPFFDQTNLSDEDRKRGTMYRQQRARLELAQQSESIEDFLDGLSMVAEVGRADDTTLQRISQLVSKTNQFNLTTRRHSKNEIAAMAANPEAMVGWLRLRDRFGDQGLVCVGILLKEDKTCRIDTFLMSCRVMNRQVEQAFGAFLVEQAIHMQCDTMVGEYLPTKKNSMVSSLYQDLGFELQVETSKERIFRLRIPSDKIRWPSFIRRRDIS